MAMEQRELIRNGCARNLRHENRDRLPAGLDRSGESNAASAFGDLDQRLPVRLVYAENGDRGLAIGVIEIRRAPDRRADPLVNVLAGIDVDAGERSSAL